MCWRTSFALADCAFIFGRRLAVPEASPHSNASLRRSIGSSLPCLNSLEGVSNDQGHKNDVASTASGYWQKKDQASFHVCIWTMRLTCFVHIDFLVRGDVDVPGKEVRSNALKGTSDWC